MTTIVPPTESQLDSLVEPYLARQQLGLGFAIGYASPYFKPYGNLYFRGNVQNQFGARLGLDGNTLFEIASISKTFTATLYALLIRSVSPSKTVGDYIAPNGPLHISTELAGIPLDSLMNYTSGLPQDDENASASTPPYWPQPYSLRAMLSYLDASPPAIIQTGLRYTYSNLGFALMAVILAGSPPGLATFTSLVESKIFAPLGMKSSFFTDVSLAQLPLGYEYDYQQSPVFAAISPGFAFLPAYAGASGVAASSNDMLQWLLFNMGINQTDELTPLLSVLLQPSTTVTYENYQLGMSWFINPSGTNLSASISKLGALDGFDSCIAFVPSPGTPGLDPSPAGVFVLVNADGITADQYNNGAFLPASLANDILLIMQGMTPPADKSAYPRAAVPRRRRTAAR
jgi:serine-type D-Ala-D-Ala carboxypeptidase/endopeptidase